MNPATLQPHCTTTNEEASTLHDGSVQSDCKISMGALEVSLEKGVWAGSSTHALRKAANDVEANEPHRACKNLQHSVFILPIKQHVLAPGRPDGHVVRNLQRS